MTEDFEPVHSVDEYYDGPREGMADFGGHPHRYRSMYLDGAEWDPDDDRFELTPVHSGAPSQEAVIARGEFRVRQPIPDLPLGQLRPLEVRWTRVGSERRGA